MVTPSLDKRRKLVQQQAKGAKQIMQLAGPSTSLKAAIGHNARMVTRDRKGDVTVGKLDKKLSIFSAGSTVSLASCGAREQGRTKGWMSNFSRARGSSSGNRGQMRGFVT